MGKRGVRYESAGVANVEGLRRSSRLKRKAETDLDIKIDVTASERNKDEDSKLPIERKRGKRVAVSLQQQKVFDQGNSAASGTRAARVAPSRKQTPRATRRKQDPGDVGPKESPATNENHDDANRGSQNESGVGGKGKIEKGPEEGPEEESLATAPGVVLPKLVESRTSEGGLDLQPNPAPPSSAARLAAALEGFSYRGVSSTPPRRQAHSNDSSGGVRSRLSAGQQSAQKRSDNTARFQTPSKSGGSLSAGFAVASPSVSFEGGHSANSSAAGAIAQDQDGDSHRPPQQVSKRRQRMALKVIAPGERVRQIALALIAEGKRVTAEDIRKEIPEEAGKKGTEGRGGGGPKRPAGVVDPNWVPPVSPYGLIQVSCADFKSAGPTFVPCARFGSSPCNHPLESPGRLYGSNKKAVLKGIRDLLIWSPLSCVLLAIISPVRSLAQLMDASNWTQFRHPTSLRGFASRFR